jgi:hypothetical protein
LQKGFLRFGRRSLVAFRLCLGLLLLHWLGLGRRMRRARRVRKLARGLFRAVLMGYAPLDLVPDLGGSCPELPCEFGKEVPQPLGYGTALNGIL